MPTEEPKKPDDISPDPPLPQGLSDLLEESKRVREKVREGIKELNGLADEIEKALRGG